MKSRIAPSLFLPLVAPFGLMAACSAPAGSSDDSASGAASSVVASGGVPSTTTGGSSNAGGAMATGDGGAPPAGVGGGSSGGAPAAGGSDNPTSGGASAGGGADNSGGMPASGGVGASGGAESGGSGGSDGSGGSATSDPCASATLCDDFEDGMDAAWAIQENSTPAPEIDSTKAKSGTSSVKITGTSQQAFITLPVPGQAFYTRAYMNFEQNTADMSGHGWFVVAADNVSQGDESQIRFGSSTNHGHAEVDMNVYAPTCGGEKTQFSDGASDGGAGWEGATTDSVNFTAGQWYCVEVYFNGPGNEAQVWVDSAELTGLHVTEASMCEGWAPTYTHIKFGAGANGNIGSIWYDDVAVSTTRIGCE